MLKRFLPSGFLAAAILVAVLAASGCGSGGSSGYSSGSSGNNSNNNTQPDNPNYPKPTNFSCESPVDHRDGINMTWSKPSTSSSITGYNVYRDGSKIASGISQLTYTDSDILGGTYEYAVSASYQGGNESYKTSSVQVTTSPALLLVEPSALTAVSTPLSTTVTSGSNFDVLVRVESVTDLFSASFELQFPASLVECTAASYDTDTSTGGTQNFLGDTSVLFGSEPVTVNQSASGRYAVSVSRDPQKTSSGVSGSGYIARVTCKAKSAGAATVSFNTDSNYLKLNKSTHTQGVPDPIPEASTILVGQLQVTIQ